MTCGMIVVSPLFYAMYVAVPKIMVSFSADTIILGVCLTSLALVGYVFSFVTPLMTGAWLVLLLIWLRVSMECIFSPLNIAALRTLPETHVGMGSGVLHVIMGLGAAVGTAGTASLLGRWTHFYSQMAAFQYFC
jgi:fucose permease